MLKLTLALSAAPDISSNPTDIALVLDRSGSMAGSPLANMKAGAKTFIDIIDEATDSAHDGQIGSGSRIGIFSFANTATADTQLITSVADLKTAVDNLSAGGSTNHADAFEKAIQLFDPTSTNAKVIVMFTDGKTTAGPPPSPVAAAARAAGIIIYCIGLVGAEKAEKMGDSAADTRGMTVKEMVKTPQFILIYVIVIGIYFAGAFMQDVTNMAVSKGFDIEHAATVSTAMMLGIIFGKIALGLLNDHIGTRTTLVVGAIFGIVSFAFLVQGGSSPIFVYAGGFLFGACCAAMSVNPPYRP